MAAACRHRLATRGRAEDIEERVPAHHGLLLEAFEDGRMGERQKDIRAGRLEIECQIRLGIRGFSTVEPFRQMGQLNPAGARGRRAGDNLLKYHQFRARLGMGDLHPGGAAATSRVLGWLAERGVQRVLEVGAGIGNTAVRMLGLGWDVTAIEPDPVLFEKLSRRLGSRARCEPLMRHASTEPYDAILGESVFFQMDLSQVFAHARSLLAPGGYLACVEALWSATVTEDVSRTLHENTQHLFGIAVGSREPLTCQDWLRLLQGAGFEMVESERLPRGSAGQAPSSDWRASLGALVQDPRLLLSAARFRLRKRAVQMPPGAQETWLFLARS